jgi:hypothetical protein
MTDVTLTLTTDEVDLLIDALDSHQYWQLSDTSRRNSGYVMEPLTSEERACDALAEKLGKLDRPARS